MTDAKLPLTNLSNRNFPNNFQNFILLLLSAEFWFESKTISTNLIVIKLYERKILQYLKVQNSFLIQDISNGSLITDKIRR